MKRHISPFKILALAAFIMLPALSRAKENQVEIEKKKVISKSYTVSPNEKLKIENSFGDVTINTWEKSEFKIDIEIYAKAKTDERAQYMLDHIKITDSRTDNSVYFKTDVHINSSNQKSSGDKEDDGDDDRGGKNDKAVHRHSYAGNQQFHVNYVVYMPATNPLYLENQFGKTTVPDFKGQVGLTSKFGSLTAGNLDNVDMINVEFGSATIGDVHNGKLIFKFDDKSSVGHLSGTVKIINEFSGLIQYNVSANIDELNINESYSEIRVVVPKDLSANFTVHTSFGGFHNNTDFIFHNKSENDEDNVGVHFDKDYTGIAGSGKATIKIKSSFGEVKLSHTALTKEQIEKEHKEKKEKREKEEAEESK
ncbi:MAG: hypothetical protein JST47_16290 [Bacteroidetes bacterium]|nr:hypothetical protein [Bacteroidota bacterium]MBS1972716.1 hypothetical protein [Bacteroidota bacterium]